jgi:putative ABC transport system ATP-binding protein
MNDPMLIEAINLDKIYKAGPVTTLALQQTSVNVGEGELIAITGPSGCGKSTLLNILGMIDRPDHGAYSFKGQLVSGLSEKERAQVRKANVGFIFQNFNLINELTISENVELPLLYTGVGKSERKERVQELLERLRIAHRSRHYPQQLSGGQQQRVAVARAIVHRPPLILADEPTGNLDTTNGDEVMMQLLDLNAAGTTVIIVTHSRHYSHFCNRTLRMLDGRILAEEIKPLQNA